MPRKKSATAKAREANGDTHPKDVSTSKKAVLDLDSDSDADSRPANDALSKISKKRKASEDAEEPAFKINEEYARRFEHNKKREELHRLEEKYGKSAASKRRKTDDSNDDSDADSLASSDESSSSEDEDEIGELVTNDLDAQIQATINAIRSKDPRVYDTTSKFFDDTAEGNAAQDGRTQKEKTMTLKQYHQKNILEGYTGADEDKDTDAPPRTYVEEQEYLKKTVVGEMHAAVDGSDNEDDFLIRKDKPIDAGEEEEAPAVTLPENPDEDPERFLNAFLTTKAWVPKGAEANIPFESDDSEEEDVAEEFEQMYNMRFEDPTVDDRSKIITHARDIAKQKSLRREEKSRRKKARDEKRERKQRELEEKAAEKNRLRNLRVEELEKKIKMVRQAGGLDLDDAADVADEKWKKFLDDAWEGDEGWEQKMGELYNDSYYEKEEDLEDGGKKSKKPKKPTWDDDIDINDLVPDFKEDELASDDEDGGVPLEQPVEPAPEKPKKNEKKKDKRADRLLRAQIESYVNDKLPLSLPGSSKQTGGAAFRYREVTPESFQLTTTDILFAGDKQLNTYAGLKKLASYRDDAKKVKDRKRYAKGKGFKLREWRKEVFGKTEVDWEELNGGGQKAGDKPKKKKKREAAEDAPEAVVSAEKKKKKRRRKGKGKAEAAQVDA
ncbi:KRRI-Interacting protein 1 [Orbilia brochopaga]|uniref:KRRI-Interacting protein 1 n=1 Tax=Orbilia brochopaga TaxID=3140254 RepID=A0AAV9U790_9PEZI